MDKGQTGILFDRIDQVSCPHCGTVVTLMNARPLSYLHCPECTGKVFVSARLANFLFLGHVGEGEVGRVYRALDEMLGREVAIKLLRGSYANDPESCERLRKEACALGKINHSRVAQVYSLSFSNGHPYLVMELVPGEDFDRKLKREGRLEERIVLKMAQDVAEGLAALNREGLVHSDIKPANIVMDRDGNSKLVDFGLAGMSRYDNNNHLMGTPDYIAPELILGEKDTPRSDIFSLGATLYHLLTGCPPTIGKTATDVLKARLDKVPIPPLNDVAPHISQATGRLIMKMLEYQPENRIQNSDIFAVEMQEVINHLDAPPPEMETVPASNTDEEVSAYDKETITEQKEGKDIDYSWVAANYYGDPIPSPVMMPPPPAALSPTKKRPLKVSRILFLLLVLAGTGVGIAVQFPPCDKMWAAYYPKAVQYVNGLVRGNAAADQALRWCGGKMDDAKAFFASKLQKPLPLPEALAPPLEAFTAEQKPAWMITNMGGQTKRGTTMQTGGALMIQLAGVGVNRRASWRKGYDHARFIWTTLSSDTYAFSGRMLAFANQNPMDVTGIQVKETAVSSNSWILFGISGANDLFLQVRTPDKKTSVVRSERRRMDQPPYLMLVRRGNVFEALHSADGEAWTSFAWCTLQMPKDHVAGFSVSTTSPELLTTVKCDAMRLAMPEMNK